MKKRLQLFFMVLACIFSIILTGCAKESPGETGGKTPPPAGERNVLVVYFSRSGNTERVARIIAEKAEGDLLELVPEQAYPDDYNTLLAIARDELSQDARPALSSACAVEMARYDTIFLGFPIWYDREPMLIHTFLEAYDFKDKQIIPFSTSTSSEAASAYSALQAACPDADFLTGRNLTGGELAEAETMISEWLANMEVGEKVDRNTLYLKINGTTLTASLVDNSSTRALKELLSRNDITIGMHDYGNFEKVGPLGTDLPRNDEQITTTAGDLILYQGNSFVIYYDTNSWNFTRLGKIQNVTQAQLIALLGSGDVSVTLSLHE